MAISRAAAKSSDGSGSNSSSSVRNPASTLILLSAFLLLVASQLASRVKAPLGHRAVIDLTYSQTNYASPNNHITPDTNKGSKAGLLGGKEIGAMQLKMRQIVEGFTLIATSRYLMLVCAYLMMTYVSTGQLAVSILVGNCL